MSCSERPYDWALDGLGEEHCLVWVGVAHCNQDLGLPRVRATLAKHLDKEWAVTMPDGAEFIPDRAMHITQLFWALTEDGEPVICMPVTHFGPALQCGQSIHFRLK